MRQNPEIAFPMQSGQAVPRNDEVKTRWCCEPARRGLQLFSRPMSNHLITHICIFGHHLLKPNLNGNYRENT